MDQASPSLAPATAATAAAQQVRQDAADMVAVIKRRVLDADPEFRHLEQTSSFHKPGGSVDFLVAAEGEPHDPEAVFGRLRWGGQFVYVSRDANRVASLPEKFIQRGFVVPRPPQFIRTGWGLPVLSRKAHYLVARKTFLIRPRDFSDRFTYHVELDPFGDAHAVNPAATGTWVVRKEVPTFERVLARLRFKAPDIPVGILEKRAKKFVEQIFPLFLTREAAMLKVIERDVPPQYRGRFPHTVHMEKDGKGYVQKLWTSWLRNGGQPITQLQFARQAAELLHILHDRIGIIHLDLRMDNMVITEQGVGFVDFGSSVRMNENIGGNAVLSTLFGELMRTSQIQRMLDRMATTGKVTSSIIKDAHQQVDKQVDLFYLAVQISEPAANPDLRELLKFDPYGLEAKALGQLTDAILRPADPQRPRFRTARDVLDEVQRIEDDAASGRLARAAAQQPPPAQTATPSKPKVWIWTK
jgi:hypothetical protein